MPHLSLLLIVTFRVAPDASTLATASLGRQWPPALQRHELVTWKVAS